MQNLSSFGYEVEYVPASQGAFGYDCILVNRRSLGHPLSGYLALIDDEIVIKIASDDASDIAVMNDVVTAAIIGADGEPAFH